MVQQETFGPVSPIIRFRDIDEAIRISNGTAYGLSSAVCTNRLDYITPLRQPSCRSAPSTSARCPATGSS